MNPSVTTTCQSKQISWSQNLLELRIHNQACQQVLVNCLRGEMVIAFDF